MQKTHPCYTSDFALRLEFMFHLTQRMQRAQRNGRSLPKLSSAVISRVGSAFTRPAVMGLFGLFGSLTQIM